MAFAAVIVKTKPAQLSIQEYVDLLRKTFRKRKEIAEGNRQIEPAEYWKAIAQRLQKENEAAKERIRELEAKDFEREGSQGMYETQLLSRQMRASTVDTELIGDPKKRRAPYTDVFVGEDEQVSQVQSSASPRAVSGSVHGHIYAMSHQMARRQDSLDELSGAETASRSVEELLSQSLQLVDLIISALSYACKSFPRLKANAPLDIDVPLKLYFHQVGRCFQSCFGALDSLCQNIAGRQKKDQLVIRLLKVVDTALAHLHSLAKEQAEQEFENNEHLMQPFLEPQPERSTDGEVALEEYLISFYLEKFLLGILNSEWQPGQGGHRELLEGTRYYIITRTANITRTISFSKPRPTFNKPNATDIPLIATLLESRHLLKVLHASLGKSNRNKEQLFSKVLGDGPCILMDKSTRKLQATLARGCFPTANAKYFRDAYEMPPVVDEDISDIGVPSLENACFDWIVNVVMTLIGLDLVIPLSSDTQGK